MLLQQQPSGGAARPRGPDHLLRGGRGTSTQGGTSQAAPHAAGAAAVLLEANPGLSADAIVSVLKETGVAVSDPRNGLTLPRINLKAALDRVR